MFVGFFIHLKKMHSSNCKIVLPQQAKPSNTYNDTRVKYLKENVKYQYTEGFMSMYWLVFYSSLPLLRPNRFNFGDAIFT
jgi:hypothetical protein